jgi:GT2 family glycosyltransferase
LVDNGSHDNSIEKIKEYCRGKIKVESKFFEYRTDNKPIQIIEYTEEEVKNETDKKGELVYLTSNKKIVLIKNNQNYGFAKGNNIGIKYALQNLNQDYFLLLNNDTVVDNNFLTELIKSAEKEEMIGIVCPTIYYYNYFGRDDTIQFAGSKNNYWFLKKKILRSKEIDNNSANVNETFTDEIHGSCFLIKKKVLEKIGLLDEEYFAYWEETDYSYRAKRKDYILKVVNNSKIWHKAGSNNPSEKRISSLASFLFAKNAFLFTNKNLSELNRILTTYYLITFRLIYFEMVYLLFYRNYNAAVSYFKGNIEGIKYLIFKLN